MRRYLTFFVEVLAVGAIAIPGLIFTGCRSAARVEASGTADTTETIVMIRHGEKPQGGLGQISCKGLNRALALPDVLIHRYGKPDYIFAPNPTFQVSDHGTNYFYIRPLATIEPTAVRAGLPVNTQFGYTQIEELQKALTQPAYANARVFVAWEHAYLNAFGAQFMKAYGDDPAVIPPWPSGDYDTIYVFQLTRTAGTTHLSFRLDHEDLNGRLSDACPK